MQQVLEHKGEMAVSVSKRSSQQQQQFSNFWLKIWNDYIITT